MENKESSPIAAEVKETTQVTTTTSTTGSKSNKTIIIVVAIIAVLLLLCCGCCGVLYATGSINQYSTNNAKDLPAYTTVTPTKSNKKYSVGDTASTNNVEVSLLSVQDYVSSSTYFGPEEGYHSIALDVSVKNVGSETYLNSPYLSFRLIDLEGYEYNLALSEKEPSLKSGNLLTGKISRGFLTYNVPNTTTEFELVFEPTFDTDSSVTFTIGK